MFAEAAPPPEDQRRRTPEHVLWWSFLGTFILRAIAATNVPFTGDEAYFVQWGRTLDGSYYDHGPVTGWLLWALLQISDHPLWLRLPALLAPIAVAWLVWITWREYHRERALWASVVIVWSLPSVLNVLITTDTPLLVLVTAAIAAAVRAEKTDKRRDYLLAGALLGLAFLAKYFAVLAGLGMLVWWVFVAPRRRWYAVGWLLVGASPFVAQHVYWNYHHSWTNVMFNVFTRQGELRLSPFNPLLFVVVGAWLLGPVTLALVKAGRSRWREGWTTLRTSPLGLFAVTALVGFGTLFVVTLVRPVGVHWVLSFYPLLMVFAWAVLRADELQRALKPTMVFGLIHLGVALLVTFVPIEWGKSHRRYASIVVGAHPDEVLRALAPYRVDATLATPSYARSALLEYNSRERVPVLGHGSFHGRQDDLRTDWRTYDRKNITLLTANPDEAERAKPWFDHAEIKHVTVRGLTYHVLVGRGFRYNAYRDEVLAGIASRFYTLPPLLEQWSAECFFKERYGFPEPRRASFADNKTKS